MEQQIGEIIKSTLPLSESAILSIATITATEIIESGDVFVQEGALNTKEYFLLEGVCRSFVTNIQGEDITLSFFVAPSIISPHISRTDNNRSNVSLQALTPITLGVMDASVFGQLMVNNIDVREFGNTVMRNELKSKVSKELSMASMPAQDRLLKLRAEFPSLENTVPHHAIASYLGITPISLSRLRGKLVK